MKLSGRPRRIELIPETDTEQQICQDVIDGKAMIFWGDSDDSPNGLALIINSAFADPDSPPAPAEVVADDLLKKI